MYRVNNPQCYLQLCTKSGDTGGQGRAGGSGWGDGGTGMYFQMFPLQYYTPVPVPSPLPPAPPAGPSGWGDSVENQKEEDTTGLLEK